MYEWSKELTHAKQFGYGINLAGMYTYTGGGLTHQGDTTWYTSVGLTSLTEAGQ